MGEQVNVMNDTLYGIFTYFAEIDEDASGYLDIQEVERTYYII